MPEFDDARTDLVAAREHDATARAARARSRAAVRQAEADARRAQRAGGQADDGARERLARAQAALKRAEGAARSGRERLAGAVEAFAPLADPRRGIGRLPADTPFLLFPVRLETRFGTATDPATGAQRPQLWVRI